MFRDSFDDLKSKLFRQYTHVDYNKSTGLSVGEIKAWVSEYVTRGKGKPVMQVKAGIFEFILKNAQIAVDDFDLYADHLNHGGILPEIVNKWRHEVLDASLDDDIKKTIANASRDGIYDVILDLSHTSPDWNNILTLGIQGLKERALAGSGEAGRQDKGSTDFYNAVAVVYDAISIYMNRLADEAAKYGTPRMDYVSGDLRHLAQHPPETFHQALQLAYIYHEAQEMEGELVRSMAGFDRLYYRFYKADIDKGIITRDQAKELIKYFFYKFMAKSQGKSIGKNFYFGGTCPDGKDCTNELSYLALEVYNEMNVVDPKFSIKIGVDTPRDFVKKAVNCIRSGNNSIVFINDDIAIKALQKRGKSLEEAREFTIIGCYEPSVMGKEMPCTTSIRFNMSKVIELVIYGGRDAIAAADGTCPPYPSYATFDDFYDEYIRQLTQHLNRAMEIVRILETKWRYINPSPVLSGTFDSCIESGLDVSEYGAKYNNSGIMCNCFASAVDSLSAVKELIYDKKEYTIDDLRNALINNWHGYENIYTRVLRCEKWGNNRSMPDQTGRKLADYMAGLINNSPNSRGGHFQMAIFSIDQNFYYGKKTGALPDGHRAGAPLSRNLSPVTAMDKEGITSVINSVTKLDFTELPNGSCLDIMLHPSSIGGGEGLKSFISLIYTYFSKGGFAVHFNVFDAETLVDAQKQPENYETLQVRVCGWNAYFVNLSKEAQDEFICAARNII